MLLVGSRAFNQHFYGGREPVDTDYIATIDEYETWVRDNRTGVISAIPRPKGRMLVTTVDGMVEFEIAWPGTSAAAILEYMGAESIASPEVMLMMKLSHRYLRNSPHFLKTMRDIQRLRELIGRKSVIPELRTILREREAETYNYAHPSLSQSKLGFFDESVPYIYEHDDIHLAVAVGDSPAYLKFQSEGEEVKACRHKFKALPLGERLLAPLEESYVLALERSVIPHGTLDLEKAFLLALSKVCTSITSGWFREFAWENYDAIVALYNPSYHERFLTAVDEGKIALHRSGSKMTA